MIYKKLLGGLVVLLAIVGVSIWYAMQQFNVGMCGNTETRTVVSPDGQIKAVVFERDCGATTGFSTQVSILRANQTLPDDGGNVLVTDASEASTVHVVWTGARTLQIQYPAQATVFHQATAAKVSLGLFRSTAVVIQYTRIGGRS